MRLIKRWMKRAEVQKNRIILPKVLIKEYGRDYYLEWYEDKIILKPIKK